MSLFDRLKRIWDLGAPPEEVTEEELDAALTEVPEPVEEPSSEFAVRETEAKPKGQATIVEMENGFDAFEDKGQDHEGEV